MIKKGITETIYDPCLSRIVGKLFREANPAEVMQEYGLTCHSKLVSPSPSERGSGGEAFDAVVLGVAHKEFLNVDLASLSNEKGVIYDVKGVLEGSIDGKL
ncbi:MAG TPA: hypothetical protein VIN72_03425 [Lutibacter sp.]